MPDEILKIKRTLAADVFSSELDLANDQVWELCRAGNPPALSACTSYGLRCGGMRIFPEFRVQGVVRIDPNTFHDPVKIMKRLGNYLSLQCAPFPLLNVELEYWVPSSQVLCGRFKVTNNSGAPINTTIAWAADLNPLGQGEWMAAEQIGVNTILKGRSGELFPVLFVTGGPEATGSAHPALEVESTLPAGASRKFTWAVATLDSVEASFALARQSTSLQWENEIIRKEMREKSSLVEFHDEDDAFGDLMHESQVKASQLLVATPPPFKRISFLNKRQPDSQVFTPTSRRQELISFSQINAYDAWMLSRVMLPGNPLPFKEIIQYFIDVQQLDGSIPWTISSSGAASAARTPPLLASLACDVHTCLDEPEWLRSVYRPLLRSTKCWFSAHDQALPHFSNSLQVAIPEHPLYATGNGGMGYSPVYIHDPTLDSMLFKECMSLLRIAAILSINEDLEWLSETTEFLRTSLDHCWDEQKHGYTYRDIESGLAYTSEDIHDFSRNGTLKLKRNFKIPRRLTFKLIQTTGPAVRVVLNGLNGDAPVKEEIELRPRLVTQPYQCLTLFTRLDTIEISGLGAKSILQLSLTGNDVEDISLLLPLWSGVMSQTRQAELIEKTLVPRYLGEAGLTTYPFDRVPADQNTILPFWNDFIIEGLIFAGKRDLAAKICTALLEAQLKQWNTNGSVSSMFNAPTRHSQGELDTLTGLPAVWPFLRVLGIERLTTKEIILAGMNEHLPSITVKYKGTSLTMQPESTTIRTVKGEEIRLTEKTSFKVVLP